MATQRLELQGCASEKSDSFALHGLFGTLLILLMVRRALTSLLCFAAAFAAGEAAPMVQVGAHPTSTLTPFPRIHVLRAFDGRIYMGSGDWISYPAVTITSYDPDAHRFIIEHSVNSDSIERLRVIDDTLFAPSADPIHYEDFKDYSYKRAGGQWRDLITTGTYHVFDMARTTGGLFAAGGNGLWRSTDNGKTWALAHTNGTRYYWCYGLGDRLYVAAGYWTGNSFVSASTFSDVSGVDAHTVTIAGQEVALVRSQTTLYRHNAGATPIALRNNVSTFTWSGDSCYTLEGQELVKGTFDSPTSVTFTTLPITGIPSGTTAVEVLGNKLYVGTAAGRLWVGNLDGSDPPERGEATVVNTLPDQFGRALGWDDNRLVVGSPDASPPGVSAILGGRVQIWSPPAVPGSHWSPGGQFTAPTPSYSGWFGKDLAVSGDYMAIVETGRDTTYADRGRSSVVHLYLKSASVWVPKVALQIPFAHGVSILNGLLAVGSANVAANQSAGQGSIHLYRLSDSGGTLSAVFLRQMMASHSTSVYKPTARALLTGNLLIAGFAGDPSRSSGRGMSAMARRTAAGDDIAEFSFRPPESEGRTGYALAAENPYFVVGSPRAIMGAALTPGAVFVYRDAVSTVLTYQSLLSPIAENAEFGAALAMANGWLLIGAPGAERAGRRHAGRVFVYRRNNLGIYQVRGEIPPPAASEGEFGIEIAAGLASFAIGSRFSRPEAPLHERIMIVPTNALTAYDFWAAAKGVQTGAQGMAADSDGDGLTNLMEYGSDTDPRASQVADAAADTGSGAPFLRTTPGRALVFHRPTFDSHLTVTLQDSPNLTTWQDLDATSVLEKNFGSYERRRFELPVTTDAARFYRLVFRYNP